MTLHSHDERALMPFTNICQTGTGRDTWMPSCYGRIRSWHRGMMSRFSNSDSRHGSDKKNINTPAWTRTQFTPLHSVVPLRTNSSNINDMIYLLTAIGLLPGGSSTVHIHTQTIHRTTQITEQHK